MLVETLLVAAVLAVEVLARLETIMAQTALEILAVVVEVQALTADQPQLLVQDKQEALAS